MATPLTQAQQVRLMLVQQKGQLDANSPADVEAWASYVIQGIQPGGGTGTIIPGSILVQG